MKSLILSLLLISCKPAFAKSVQADNLILSNPSSEFTAILGVPSLAADYSLTLPVDDGTLNYTLLTDGSGVLSWGDLNNVSGILSLAKGGSNKNLTASAGSVIYSDGDSFELTAVGTNGQVLVSNGAGAPSWTASSGSAQFTFSLDGPYASVISTTADDQGPQFIAPYNLQITSVCMYVKTKGTSGTTTLDLQKSTKALPNVYSTIFSTKPAATTTITDGERICTGDGPTVGWAIPIMSPNPYLMNQYDGLRLDVDAVMADSEDVGLIIFYQPQ